MGSFQLRSAHELRAGAVGQDARDRRRDRHAQSGHGDGHAHGDLGGVEDPRQHRQQRLRRVHLQESAEARDHYTELSRSHGSRLM